MPSSSVLPVSAEASALTRSLNVSAPALADTTISMALLLGGVLHFVTPPPALDDLTWQLISTAVTGSDGRPQATAAHPGEVVIPLVLHQHTVGILLARRQSSAAGPPAQTFVGAELALLHVIGQGVTAAVENGRLHHNLAELLADYMSPDVARTLLADPTGTKLGGETLDITVLFADLKGFTTFSERNDPAAVVALLNRYFGVAVPAIVEHGGTVSAFIGDAIMALFGAPHSHPEHPLQAVRAALAMQAAIAGMSVGGVDLPKFRVGINTGPATVGNVGSQRRRVFTAIGDTVNLASRLEGVAPPGGVVVGAATHAVIRHFAEVRAREPVTVKGKAHPVAVYEVLRLRSENERLIGSETLSISLEQLRELQEPKE